MSKIRLASVVITFFIGLLICASQLMEGNWISGLAIFISGILVCILLLFGIHQKVGFKFKLLVSISLLVTISSILYEHRAFNIPLKRAHSEALYAVLDSRTRCPHLRSELVQLGVSACAIQDYEDLKEGTIALLKANYMDPVSSFVDSGVDFLEEKPVDLCAKVYKSITDQCSSLKNLVSQQSNSLLLN